MTEQERQAITGQFNELYQLLFEAEQANDEQLVTDIKAEIQALNDEQMANMPVHPNVELKNRVISKLSDLDLKQDEIDFLVRNL